jgi:hypothetical protein
MTGRRLARAEVGRRKVPVPLDTYHRSSISSLSYSETSRSETASEFTTAALYSGTGLMFDETLLCRRSTPRMRHKQINLTIRALVFWLTGSIYFLVRKQRIYGLLTKIETSSRKATHVHFHTSLHGFT